ncbi:hypothetical protein Y1Q_0005579 [Alligator mississippiensis]|uniref:Fibrinogen C-terminal domain-containing protein n=1 Tax=Alligator mississippiensis TaxID=8496 RepID=A0A151MFG3_ALLMI|nr:hypothetical protein Y1Q_0005579 [Alligator mississippiensis]
MPGDSLTYHNSTMFSTKDQNNDLDPSNSPNTLHGGWWFNACLESHLNGKHLQGAHDHPNHSVVWTQGCGDKYFYKVSEVKLSLVS